MEFARRGGAGAVMDYGCGERRANHAGVGRHGLAGTAGGEQFDEGAEVFARRENFLDAGDGDVQRRHERGHADVGFAFDEDDGAGIGGDEIGAGDSGVGAEEFFAQAIAREGGERFAGVKRKIGFENALEQRRDSLAAVMQRGADNVRRLLVGDLQNEFSEIGFGHLDVQRFEHVV